jgi:hypothetical protein
MFVVIRINAIRGHDNLPVALVGVDGRHADTGMRIDARQDKSIGLEICENLIKGGAEKRAVAFLDEILCRRERLPAPRRSGMPVSLLS